MLVAVECSTD